MEHLVRAHRAWAAVLLSVGLVAVAAPASATTGRFVCEDRTRVEQHELYADVLVPADATCRLGDVTVHGDLLVAAGGTTVLQSSTVLGDVVTSGAVHLVGATVDGDVLLDGQVPDTDEPAQLRALDSALLGDVRGHGAVRLVDSTVDGDVDVLPGGGPATAPPPGGTVPVEGMAVLPFFERQPAPFEHTAGAHQETDADRPA